METNRNRTRRTWKVKPEGYWWVSRRIGIAVYRGSDDVTFTRPIILGVTA